MLTIAASPPVARENDTNCLSNEQEEEELAAIESNPSYPRWEFLSHIGISLADVTQAGSQESYDNNKEETPRKFCSFGQDSGRKVTVSA